jgi:hypothetical protein
MSPISEDTIVVRNGDGDVNINNNTHSTSTTTTTTNNNKELILTKMLKKTMIHLEQLRYKLQRETYKTCKNNEWLLVGILFDKIFFLIFCSIILISTMTIFKN